MAMRNEIYIWLTFVTVCILFSNCSSEQKEPQKQNTTPPQAQIPEVPEILADSIYAFIENQLAFGPRVPGTDSHKACADWLVTKLKAYCGKNQVTIQKSPGKLFDGTTFELKNIIAQIRPEISRRILLMAHWDSRKFADHDINDRNMPIAGANDGASGVAVLLELARVLRSYPFENYGLDIVLFDAEDQGVPDNMGYQKDRNSQLTWCLGSQYWANNPHRPASSFAFGILLDMVGAKNARFPREGASRQYAPRILNKVWNEARNQGFSNYFSSENTREIIDDHVFVNQIAGIPSIDIIHLEKSENGFWKDWHTHRDNLETIDKATLHAVGTTLVNFLCKEDAGLYP